MPDVLSLLSSLFVVVVVDVVVVVVGEKTPVTPSEKVRKK